MEALWNLEDQLKLSTPKAIALFLCTSFLTIGFCIAIALKRRARRKGLVDQEPPMDEPMDTNWSEPRPGWGSVKKILMSSVVWCGASKWKARRDRGSGGDTPSPLLVKGGCEAEVGWQSHNSDSPVWQRPILMGDKCELPRFSGLILYDENGCPLHYSNKDTNRHEDITAAFERTTLRDLL